MKSKLVRDNIPTIIDLSKGKCLFAKCESKELLKTLLNEKLDEEVQEFKEAVNGKFTENFKNERAIEEAIDVMAVLLAMINADLEDFEKLTIDKLIPYYNMEKRNKGEFTKGYILFTEEKETNNVK